MIEAEPNAADSAAQRYKSIAEGVRALVHQVNSLKQFLRPEELEKFRRNQGEKLADEIEAQRRDSLGSAEQKLLVWSAYAVEFLGAFGDLPSRQPDGTWTAGSFSMFHWEYGFEVRAESGKPVAVIEGRARQEGDSWFDFVIGTEASDVFTTLTGEDYVSDSGGLDFIEGGEGEDEFLVGWDTNGQYNVRQSWANPAEWTLINTGTTGLSRYTVTLGANGTRTVNGADGRISRLHGFETVSFVGGAFGSDGGDTLYGRYGVADILVGLSGSDTFSGGGGNDTIHAGDGDDVIRIGADGGQASVIGGAGTDTIEATADNIAIRLSFLSGVEAITANGHAGVYVLGTAHGDLFDFTRTALTGITQISSGGGDDTVIGSGGGDVIAGGLGRDLIAGAGGADRFRLFDAADSAVGDADFLIDFSTADGDRIDLQIIDPDPVAKYNQTFTFVGSAAFSAKGQVRAEVQADGNTHVYGTANGSTPYFEIVLSGRHGLQASDFVL